MQEGNTSSTNSNTNTEPGSENSTPNEESNSLTQSLNALKTFNPRSNYQVDTYVDAVDSYSTWRVAKVLAITKDDAARLNFDGWASKWDETIKLGGSKIAPFKKMTPPYTGGLKAAIREFNFEESKDLIIKTIVQLNSAIKKKIKVTDPQFINQFFRGRVYILMDAVLSQGALKTQDDLKLVTEFMETYIDFFIEYLNVLPSLLKEYIDGKALNQPLLYLVNDKIGLVSCIPEVFDTMVKLFGGSSRLKVFGSNEFPSKSYHSPQAVKPKDKYTGTLHNQIVNCINHFGTNGGFEKLLNLIKWELKAPGDAKNKNEPTDAYRFPLHYIRWILQVIAPVTPLLTSAFKDKFGQELKIAFFERVEKLLTNRDLKDNENQIQALIRESLSVFEDFLGKDAYVICEQAELEVTLVLLKSPFLERKIKAINEFKDFFDRADPQVEQRQLGDKKRFRHLTNDKLKSWILSKKILEYVMGDQSHVELLKRLIPIMKFLANAGALSQEHLDLLWKGCNSTHEEYVRAVYDAVVELSSEISVESTDYLFSKIKDIPIASYNEPIIDLITKFTLNGMKNASTTSPTNYFARTMKRTPKYEFYGIKLLWEAIQDESPLKQEFTQLAFNSITKIIKHQSFKTEKDKYLTACFDNLKKGVSVPQSLLLSLHILMTYSNQSGLFGQSSALEEIVAKLQKEYNLVDSVVNDFEKYMKEVAVVMKDFTEKGAVPADKGAYCFVGRYSHASNIDHRLLFIENIGIQIRKGDFTIEHMKNLWNNLIKNSVTEVERGVFLKWLIKCKLSAIGKTKTYVISDTLMRNFFSNVLCDEAQMDFKNFTPETFTCFEKYFEIINEREENIRGERNAWRILKFNDLIGYNVLWKILMNCNNEKVERDVKNLLVNVHLKLGTMSAEEKLEIWQSFMNRWMECLQAYSQSKDNDLLVNTISLLNLFIVRFDGRKYLDRDEPVSETVSIVVTDKKDERSKKSFDIPANATLYLLRKKIGEEFDLAVYDFDMYITPNFKVSLDIEEDYKVTIIESEKGKEKEVFISIRPSSSAGLTHKDKFKNVLINNQRIMDILFDLLGSNNSKVVNDIWEILGYLPFNRSLRSSFEKLAIENEQGWFQLLDVSCKRKLLYCLRIVNDLAGNPNNNQWNLNFIKKKGFNHLLTIYFAIESHELSSLFDCKAAATIVRLLNFFIENYSSELNLDAKQLEKTFEKVLSGLSLVTKNDFITDAEDPHLQEDLKRPAEELVLVSFDLLKTCIKLNPELVKNIYNFPDLSLLIRNGLIESNDRMLRIDFMRGFFVLFKTMNQIALPEGLQSASSFFLSFLLKDLLDYAFSHRDKCKEFFGAIESIMKYCEEKDFEAAKIDFHDLASQLAEKLISLTPFEAQQSDQDFLLQGLMSLLRMIFTKKPTAKDEVLLKSQPRFLEEVVHNCLFEIPSALVEKGAMTGPKCKSPESRRIAILLLQSMTVGTNEITVRAVEYLKKLLLNHFWRTASSSDWNILSMTAERNKTGYAGLENLGCTCYMNSLMQQLYMICDFRDTLLETEDINEGKVDDHDNLFHQIQLIFGALKISQRQYYDPRLFCYAFKDYEGNPTNVFEQMDVDEFFNTIMDRLENVIKPTKNEGIIKRIFGGVFSNELICKGCPHYSEREEPSLAISLQVKNKKNILESLQNFTQGEMLEGDNAYLCDKCDKKVSTLKRVCIKKLPNILILVLKRFEFDFDTMQRFKVNDYCEFPQELNMLPYTQGFLKKKENNKDELSEEALMNEPQEYPAEYYKYTLRGTVIHMGTADSGHYYSLIKDNNADNWFEFNDNIVRPFDLRDLPQEAFGGEEKLNIENMGNAKEVKERSRNAYLLFYEREAYFDDNANKVPTMLIGEQNREVRSENMSAKILKEIKEDNYKFHVTKYLWDREYGDYVFKLLEQLNQKKDLANPTPELLETAKYCTLYFLTVQLRSRERSRIPKFLKEFKALFKASPPLSTWLVKCFVYPDILKEFLIDCPIPDMKYFVVGLLRVALKNAYTECKDIPPAEFEQSVLGRFITTVVNVIYDQKAQVKQLDKMFDILAYFSSLGSNAKLILIQKKMVGRIIYYMAGDKNPQEYKEYTEEFALNLPGEVSDLGKVSVSNGVKANELVKSVSEIISKKKEKSLLESTSTNYNSLIETLANLVMSVKLVNGDDNNQQNYLNVELDDDEKKLITANPNVIQLLFIYATTKRARKIVSNLIAYILYKREDYSKHVFLVLERELKEKDDLQLKVILQCLEKIMLIQDEFQKMRVDKGMNILMNVIKENSRYYRATEICLDYLFKLCARNSWALRLCSENKSFLKFAETWLRENSNPYSGFSSGNLKLFKKRNYKIVDQALSQYQAKFTSKSQERLAKLKKIHKNESEELAPEYDSDEDFSDHQYQVGEKLDYLTDFNGWMPAQVTETVEEMIQISFSNDSTKWIHYDTDRTGPHLKVQTHTKNNVDFYKAA